MLHHQAIYDLIEIRTLEKEAIERGTPVFTLMQQAGKSAFQFTQTHWPQAKRFAIFCGTGNNGGDGYVLAHAAQKAGLSPLVYTVGDPANLSPTAKQAAVAYLASGGITQEASTFVPQYTDLIVDAILGIGLTGAPREIAHDAIQLINQAKLPTLAIDIPSGLNAETGEVKSIAVFATHTLTFIGLKKGLFNNQALSFTGQVHINTLGLASHSFAKLSPRLFRLFPYPALPPLPPRPRQSHKGDFGHVLVIGGDAGYGGAARLAGEAALRTGAGLVSIATHPSHASALNATRPELMVHGITSKSELKCLLPKATVIILGPGMVESTWSQRCYQVAKEAKVPMIIDAGALTFLSKKQEENPHWILTPHPGEAARLLQTKPKKIKEDRFSAVRSISEKFQCLTILKGAGTLIHSPDQQSTSLCDAGNPGMASGGMGDLLTGIVAGLISQSCPLHEAAQWGVLIHATAADLATQHQKEGSLLASDLLPFLPSLIHQK
jgi:hydroxyethylthiazole kinase-like uncharacterized protein yjeF